jgi:hypothetical protein
LLAIKEHVVTQDHLRRHYELAMLRNHLVSDKYAQGAEVHALLQQHGKRNTASKLLKQGGAEFGSEHRVHPEIR